MSAPHNNAASVSAVSGDGAAEGLHIRLAEAADLDQIMQIYAAARSFMAQSGNPHQWGDSAWPWREVIADDIDQQQLYVACTPERPVAVFFYREGERIEPEYNQIEGSWIGDEHYAVVHRIAADGSVRGAGRACLQWAIKRAGHVRIDTHDDNAPMQHVLTELGFVRCGVVQIHTSKGLEPRVAYEWVASAAQA